MDSLITTTQLAEQLAGQKSDGTDKPVVLDCTVFLHMGEDGYVSESGLANFEAGHVPGAAFADLNEALVDTTSKLRYVIPSPEHFAQAMEQLGVSDRSRVVLYDHNRSMWAARVWWMLRWIGFDNAALLDGGLKAWKNEDRELETGPPSPTPAPPGSLSPSPRPRLIADRHEVMASIGDGAVCLIDALPAEVYSGQIQPYARPGHIPGAVNVPANSIVDPDTGRFRDVETIRALLPGRPEARTVAY